MLDGQTRSFFPFHQPLFRFRLDLPANFEWPNSLSLQTKRYVPVSNPLASSRSYQTRLRLLGRRKDLSQPTIFLTPAFITFGS